MVSQTTSASPITSAPHGMIRDARVPNRHPLQEEFADAVTETRWHPTQTGEDHDDDSVTLRFTIDSLDKEIVWWV